MADTIAKVKMLLARTLDDESWAERSTVFRTLSAAGLTAGSLPALRTVLLLPPGHRRRRDRGAGAGRAADAGRRRPSPGRGEARRGRRGRDHGPALEVLGRRDGQVKLRGLRIELDDVADALLRHPGVHDVHLAVIGADAEGPVCWARPASRPAPSSRRPAGAAVCGPWRWPPTHPAMHFPLALAAMRAGKHVLVEKPLCVSACEAETLALARERAAVCLQEAVMAAHHPWPGAVSELAGAHGLGVLRGSGPRSSSIGRATWATGPIRSWAGAPSSTPRPTGCGCSRTGRGLDAAGVRARSAFDGPNGTDAELDAEIDYADGTTGPTTRSRSTAGTYECATSCSRRAEGSR